MAKKIKLTRPELKRRRDALTRYERYLPTLKLKQQQLQMSMREVELAREQSQYELSEAQAAFEPYSAVLADRAGLNVRETARIQQVKTATRNVAGINVPVFEDAVFVVAEYSLFATPSWVDRALTDLKKINRRQAALEVIQQQQDILHHELVRITQRVNLFEKVMIPATREAIRRIRIALGDQMTAGVVRAKIAKAKLAESEHFSHDNHFLPAGTEAGQ